MAKETLVVYGYRDLLKANAKAEKEARLFTRHELKKVGDLVRVDATRRFAPIDSRSAAGYKTRVRQKGIAVEQSIKKTTGERGRYGVLQMHKGLLPALYGRHAELRQAFERALERIADKHERVGNQ